tara:strand:- start:420 stop:524 length:105 start_codon:yes stop_codon:yes gene_type:complete
MNELAVGYGLLGLKVVSTDLLYTEIGVVSAPGVI